MYYCSKCNQPLPDTATTCLYCGAPQQTASAPQPVAVPTPAASAPQPVYQAPVAPTQPAYQAPAAQSAYQAPAAQPAYQAPAAQPVYQAPAEQPMYQAPVAQPSYQPAYQIPVAQPTAQTAAEEQEPAYVKASTAAKVLGILGIVFCWFPPISILLLIPGIITAVVGMIKSRVKKGRPVTGVVLCSVALLLTMIFSSIWASALELFDDFGDDYSYGYNYDYDYDYDYSDYYNS